MRGLVQSYIFTLLTTFTVLSLISSSIYAAPKKATVSVATQPDYSDMAHIIVFVDGKKVNSLTNSYDNPGDWFKVKLKKGSYKFSVIKPLDADDEYYGEQMVEIDPDFEPDPHVLVKLKKRPKSQTAEAIEKAKVAAEERKFKETQAKENTEVKLAKVEEYKEEKTKAKPEETVLVEKVEKAEKVEDKAPAQEEKPELKKVKAVKVGVALDDIPLPEMVKIPAGSFTMGCDAKSCAQDEKPAHKVKIKAFSLAKYEVTVAAWQACYNDGGCAHNAAGKKKQDDDKPISNVSWKDVQAYIRWLNKRTGKKYRLPTEAEWEYAARSGTTTRFSYGDCIDTTKANFNSKYKVANTSLCKDSKRGFKGDTVKVGQYPANKFGLYDMHGNVWEWVEDCWSDSYDKASSKGVAAKEGNCSLRVLRGGAWVSPSDNVRSSYRFRYMKSARDPANGFRLAM